MAAPTPIPEQETVNLIVERARVLKEAGEPALFEMNVSRRNNAGIPQQMASFKDVTIEHIMNPVRWVPMLFGGGEYVLNVRHPSLPDRIGGPLVISFDKSLPGMEPKAIDPRITKLPTWQGPTLAGGVYVEPAPGAPSPAHAGASVTSWAAQAQPNTLTTGYGLPPSGSPTPDRERELQQQLMDTKAQLARIEAESKMRTELENERRANEARVREAEARAEAARRDSERQLSELRSQMATLAAPRPDASSGWKDLINVVMPLVQQLLTGQHETRMAMMKMSEEQNRRQIEAAEKQHQTQMEMIRAVSAQKPGMSEELRLLLDTLMKDRSNNGAEAMGAFMTRQLEAMGMMSKMSLDLVHAAADMTGDGEHPVVGAIREAASAVGAMMKGSRDAAAKMIPRPPAGLPQGQQQQQLTPQQVAQIRAQQAAQAQAQARAAAAARAPGPVTVPTPPVVAAAPVAAPAPVVAPAAPAAAPATPAPAPAPQLMQAPDGRLVTHFDVLRDGIASLKDPTEVVDYFVQLKNANEPSLKAKLDAHSGSPWELLQAEFGLGFISQHGSYFEQLGEVIDARGVQEGWWAASEDDEAESEEETLAVPESVTEPVVAGPVTLTVVPDAPAS